jgi:hypothetical protein
MHFLWSGYRHTVHQVQNNGANHVRKSPKIGNLIPLDRAMRSIAFFQEHFRWLVAETMLSINENGAYEVIQPYIWDTTLAAYFQEHEHPTREIHDTLMEFMERANWVFEQRGITFDILWTQRGERITFTKSTNFVLNNAWVPIFVDTVDATKSIWQSLLINKLAHTIMKWRRKRAETLWILVQELHSWTP